jgi:hypothetical protein
MSSRWRVVAEGLRGRVPRGMDGRQISGIVQRYLGTGEGALNRISGMSFSACMGHTHPLDGCSVDFGLPGIPREEVPSPWRELLAEPLQPFTFSLDSPDQDAPQ